jgi:cytochrome b561
LRLKDRRIPVTLPFTLTITGDRAVMDGELTIARDAADLGQASDPDADYVSADIVVRVHVEANRAR